MLPTGSGRKTERTELINRGHVGSSTHRIAFSRWTELTFALLPGGHNAHQASAEVRQRTARIRQFLTKLLEPYCVQRGGYGVFSELIDKILHWAVAIGYHLLGMPNQYRWDWTWLAPVSKELFRSMLGQPPPRPPPEEEVPAGIWITAPALVRETSFKGLQLAEEITFIGAHQFLLQPPPLEVLPLAKTTAKEE